MNESKPELLKHFYFPSLLLWCCGSEIKGSSIVSTGNSSVSPWHLGAGPAQSQNGCSFVPQRWQTYCIALCTRQTAGSCRAEFKGRPAPAPAADWLRARLVTAGSTAALAGRPAPWRQPPRCGEERTRWRQAACARRSRWDGKAELCRGFPRSAVFVDVTVGSALSSCIVHAQRGGLLCSFLGVDFLFQ